MYNDAIEQWLLRDPDPETRAELKALVDADDDEELERRFSGRLAFGTAGLRGVLGAGPMRMNRLVVQETTAGLADYLLEVVPDAQRRGVVIGYDGRIGSDVFSRDAANILIAKGFRVYLADKMVPTPVAAYGVLHFGAAAGIMVTASHNPPEYNGYKVYWGNGAQIIPPHDKGIAAAIDAVTTQELPWPDDDSAWEELVTPYGDALIETYLEKVDALTIHEGMPKDRAELVIAYTPLHGVGAECTEATLKRGGFENVHTVASQREPDGNFPTVNFPNPEEPGAMDAVVALATEVGADLAIANDPDADRLAVAARRPGGTYQMLRGDQVGALLGLDRLEADADVSVATTIVSSQLLGEMAKAKGARYFETLTGFKWIANGAMALTEKDGTTFAFGYEEALGYTIGELVRDKDGVSAVRSFCEMAAHLRRHGKTVLDRLEEIYREYGLYLTAQRSLHYGPDDEALADLCGHLRKNLPGKIGGLNVVSTSDLLEGVRYTADGESKIDDLPPSDVLVFHLDGGARVIVRPSGTEPKIKCYYEVRGEVGDDFDEAMEATKRALTSLVEAHQAELSDVA